jgi:hypothetical protein
MYYAQKRFASRAIVYLFLAGALTAKGRHSGGRHYEFQHSRRLPCSGLVKRLGDRIVFHD